MTAPKHEHEVLEKLRSHWTDATEKIVSDAVVAHYLKNPNVSLIPFASFLQLARQMHVEDSRVVMRVVQYLCGAETPLLNILFEYIEDDGTTHILDRSQVNAVRDRSINPLTGEVDLRAAEKVIPAFEPSELAIRVFRADA